jgi:hypothetical protein
MVKSKLRNSPIVTHKQKMKPMLVYAVWTFAIATFASITVFVALNFGNVEKVFAASTFTSTTTGGNWTVGSTWTGGSAPGNWADNTANINGNTTLTSSTTDIKGFTLITLNNGKSLTSGTSSLANNLTLQSVTFNVVNGTFTVYGNLSISSSTLAIMAGTLNVTGTLNINSGATVSVSSGASITAGALSISNNSDAILNNGGIVTINGNVSQGGVVNNNSTGSMQVNGNLTSTGSGSSKLTNSGNLNVEGSITLPNSGKLYNNPGGKILVNTDVVVSGNQNLINGTNVAPPQYADLVVKRNLVSSSSGDVLFDKNSRVMISGNVTDSGDGGTLFIVNNGGQVYVDGSISYTGGGNSITNNNTTNPYGLYVNGTITNSGGGSVTTANKASKSTLQTTNPPFYAWVVSQLGALPIKLIAFKINDIEKDGITLTWATASEENFDRFSIERSNDGNTFQSIAEVKGAGNSKTMLRYSFKDEHPAAGKSYFRLKAIDQDGKFEYSPVLTVDFESSNKLTIYPNPSNGEYINFAINFNPTSDDVISILDLSGSEIVRQQVDEGTGRIVFNTTLKSGAYIVKYTSAQFNHTERMVVR